MISLKKWRKKRGLSQEQAAKELKLSRRQVQLIEAGLSELRLDIKSFERYISAVDKA